MNVIKPESFANRRIFKSQPASVTEARLFVEKFLANYQLPGSFIFNMGLVVGEAVANAVSHGSHSTDSEVALSVQIQNNMFQLLIEDYLGREFDPEYFRRIAMVKDWGKGGRGIMMMELMMDNMTYIIEENSHTLLFLEKALPTEAIEETMQPDDQLQ